MFVTAGVTANSYIIANSTYLYVPIRILPKQEKVAISRLILLLMKRPVSIALFASLLVASFAIATAQETAVVPIKASVNDTSECFGSGAAADRNLSCRCGRRARYPPAQFGQ